MSEANEQGSPWLSADERQALEWARQTPNPSVARYAKTLATVVERLTNAMDAMPQVAVDVAADDFTPSPYFNDDQNASAKSVYMGNVRDLVVRVRDVALAR